MFGTSPFLRVVFLMALLLVPAACDSAEERLAKHYERGVELAEQGEPEKAILEFRNALRLDETHVPSLFGIAEALEEKGDLIAAVRHLQRVIEVEPSHVPARVKLAQAMLLGGAVDEARTHAEAAHALAPDDPDVLAVRAAVNLRRGEVDVALADAEAALERAPEHAQAGLIVISARINEGKTGEAMELTERFLEAHPKNLPLNLVKLRLLEQDRTRQDEFVRHLEHVVELYPEERGFRLALAEIHRRRGDDKAAIEVMRGLVDLDPENVERVMQLVAFLRKVEGEDAARAELAARIDAAEDPEQAFPYHQALVELDLAAGDRAAAEARLDRVIEEQGLTAARIARARLHLAQEQKAEAQALVEDVLENDPRNVDALAMRAALEIDKGDPDAAVRTLRTALNEAPERIDLLRLSGIAYEQTGNPQLAGENLAAAVRISDYAPEQVIAYVRFLRQRDRDGAAATVLEEALRRNPKNRDLLATAADLRLVLEDWAAAENLAAQLDALDDEESGVLANRIRAAARGGQGQLGETIEILEGIAQGTEDSDAAFVQLVQSYVRAGRIGEATAFVEGVLQETPDNVIARLMRGALHAAAGETQAAETSFRDAIEAAPGAPAPWLALMRLYGNQGDLDRVREVTMEAIDAVPAPGDWQIRLALANLQEAEGDFDAAMETYRVLHGELPTSAVVANNLASLLSDHRADDPESLALAARVARRLADSPVPQFQDTYGWTLYLSGGDRGAALDSLRQAVEGLPNNPWVQYHIGEVYASLGETAKAREHLERARELGGETFPRLSEIDETLQGMAEPQAN